MLGLDSRTNSQGKLMFQRCFVEAFRKVEHRWRYLKRKGVATICVPSFQTLSPYLPITLQHVPLDLVVTFSGSLADLRATFFANEAPVKHHVHITPQQLLNHLPGLILTPVHAL